MALISGVQVNDNTYGLRAEAIPTGSITSDTNGILTATVPKITQLTPGIICIINNSLNLSQSIISLNVNSLGAKPIYDSMTNSIISDFTLKSNETFLFSYNETLLSTGCWILHHSPVASINKTTIIITESNGTFTSNKTLTEINAAIAADNLIEFINENGVQGWYLGGDNTVAQFLCIYDENGTPSLYIYSITDQGVFKIIQGLNPFKVSVSGTSPTISVNDNTIYTCNSTLTSLTLTDILNKDFSVIFTSGSTPTTLTVPSNLRMPDGFTVEAEKRYEINVANRYAVVMSWEDITS